MLLAIKRIKMEGKGQRKHPEFSIAAQFTTRGLYNGREFTVISRNGEMCMPLKRHQIVYNIRRSYKEDILLENLHHHTKNGLDSGSISAFGYFNSWA